jgi:hypothetical protein
MTTVPAKKADQPTPSTIEDVLIRGDLSKLTEAQRNEYYMRICQSLGLNPLTQPFAYLMLSGKLVLYPKRDCADQLRKINGISVEIVSRDIDGGLLIVHARAKDKTERSDEDFGVVPFKSGGGTEFAANAMMKAVTKAKRRVTLSISGLGFMDESEMPVVSRDAAINPEQRKKLTTLADEVDADLPVFFEYLSDRWDVPITSVADIPATHYDDAVALLERKREAIAKTPAHDPETGEVSDANA